MSSEGSSKWGGSFDEVQGGRERAPSMLCPNKSRLLEIPGRCTSVLQNFCPYGRRQLGGTMEYHVEHWGCQEIWALV